MVKLVEEATADPTGAYDCNENLPWEGHCEIERIEYVIEIWGVYQGFESSSSSYVREGFSQDLF